MLRQKFVGRDKETVMLEMFLNKALSKQGGIIFLSGEAGTGKTALINEFASRTPAHVLIIKGMCNAQTGIGDPYLPFKEILEALIGDIGDSLSQGRINQHSVSILGKNAFFFLEALVNHGFELVDILISNDKVTCAIKHQIETGDHPTKAKELLKVLGKKNSIRNTSATLPNIFQGVFDYFNFLSSHQPLVLLFDDLHWADSATINLLFYLGRRIEKSKILIIGTYRPDEVLLGRGGERHPLEKAIAEFKLYFGDVIIDLDKLSQMYGRSFIDAILDSEPNLFDNDFRESFFLHTSGHALFTVELLESMKEKGIVYTDDEGRWIPRSKISWDELPARVEGIVEERIGRLGPDLHEILSIASVEGEVFTAEVVAQVGERSEKLILRQLSQELERRHRLVREQGEIVINQLHLQRFQFSHAVFQQYLYKQLGDGQKRVLHQEIAQILEILYGSKIDDVLMQLVHHYTVSGNEEKAMSFLIKAGEIAAKSYAFTEARLHYRNAREILLRLPDNETSRRERIELIFKYMVVSSSSDNPKEVLQLLEEAENLIKTFLASEKSPNADSALCKDWEKLARIYLWIGRAYYNSNQLYDAIRCYNKIIPIAQGIQNEFLGAMATGLIGRSLATQGQFGKAESVMVQVQETIERSKSWHDWIWNTEFLSSCIAIQGRITDAYVLGQQGLAKAEEINYPMAVAMAHSHLALVSRAAHNPQSMLEHSIKATKIAEQTSEKLFIYIGYGFQAWSHALLGNIESALILIQTSKDAGKSLSDQLVRMDWFAAIEAEIALKAGDYQRAVICSENAIKIAQPMGGIFSQGIAHRVWGQALSALAPHKWDDVESHIYSALHFFEMGNAVTEVADTYSVWGELCKSKGDVKLARMHFLDAIKNYKITDLSSEAQKIALQLSQLDTLMEISNFINPYSNQTTTEIKDIREMLLRNFDDPELDSLCLDYFPSVWNRFSRGLRRDEKINLLLDHCRRSGCEAYLVEIIKRKEGTI